MEESKVAMWPLKKAREMIQNGAVTSIKIQADKNEKNGLFFTLVFNTRFKQEAKLRTSHSQIAKNRLRMFDSEKEARTFILDELNYDGDIFTCEKK